MTADSSPEIHHVLDAFAPEHNPIVPPRHAAHTPLAHDFQFVFDRAPLPLPAVRKARGLSWLALAVLVVLCAAAVGAYLYYPSRPFDVDTVAEWASEWASRLASPRNLPRDAATTPQASSPSEAQPDAPMLTDPLFAPKESAVSPTPKQTVDARSNAANAKVSEIARPTTARPEHATPAGSLVSPVQKVSGEWRLDTQIEAGDSFQSLNVHYEMTLKQDGDRVAGVGTRLSEGAQTPLTMTGNIVRDRLTLNVIEGGTQPETRTKFVLLINEAGTLRGRFSSSAEPSSGHAEAHRVSAQ